MVFRHRGRNRLGHSTCEMCSQSLTDCFSAFSIRSIASESSRRNVMISSIATHLPDGCRSAISTSPRTTSMASVNTPKNGKGGDLRGGGLLDVLVAVDEECIFHLLPAGRNKGATGSTCRLEEARSRS